MRLHPEILNRCFSKRQKFSCYWIPLLSFVSPNSYLYRPLQTTTFLSSSRQDLEQLTVVQLKEKLRDLGLQVSGRKAVLIERLEDFNPDLDMAPSKRTKSAVKSEAPAKVENANSPRKRALRKANDALDESKETGPAKKKKASDHQRITDRDDIPKLWDSKKAQENGSYSE
eukprot:scaffold15973_cov120-Cylindrotheca_fusiformis.AAC.7